MRSIPDRATGGTFVSTALLVAAAIGLAAVSQALASGDDTTSGTFPPGAVTPADPTAPTKLYTVPAGAMRPTIAPATIIRAQLYRDPRNARPVHGDIVVTHPARGADPGSSRLVADRRHPDAYAARCGDPDARRRGEPCGRSVGGAWRAERYVKRVVGVPGDRIAIRRGQVIRNGSPTHEPYLSASCRRSRATGLCNLPRSIVVPAGQYYVLGDDRKHSNDSRLWGPVRRSWLVGFVVAVGVEHPRSELPLG